MWHLCRAGASCNVELPPLATLSNFGVPTPTTTRMNSIILTSVYNCTQMYRGDQHENTNSIFCTRSPPIDRVPTRKSFPKFYSPRINFRWHELGLSRDELLLSMMWLLLYTMNCLWIRMDGVELDMQCIYQNVFMNGCINNG